MSDALTNALAAFSTVDNHYRQDRQDAENTRRWEAENKMREDTHALQMQTGKLNLDMAQTKYDDMQINRFANELGSTGGDSEKILALHNQYKETQPDWYKKVINHPMLKNAEERVAAYKDLGQQTVQMPTTGDPTEELNWKAGLIYKMQDVLKLDDRLKGLDNPQVVDVATSPTDPKKFNVQIQYTGKDGKLVNAFLTDGQVKSAEGGKPTDYDIPTLMGSMQNKMQFLEGVGQLKLLANDPDAVKQMERKVYNQKAIDIMLQDPGTTELLKHPVYGGLYQTQLKLNSEGFGTPEESMKLMQATQQKVAEQKLEREDAAYFVSAVSENVEAATKGNIKAVQASLKEMAKDPNKTRAAKSAMDVLLGFYKTGIQERNANARAARAGGGGSAPATGVLDQQAIATVNGLLSKANALESGKETVTDEYGMTKTQTVAVDPEGAARYRDQAAQVTALYATTGKVSPSFVGGVSNALPERSRQVLVSTLKGGGGKRQQAVNTNAGQTPNASGFGNAIGGQMGAALFSIPR